MHELALRALESWPLAVAVVALIVAVTINRLTSKVSRNSDERATDHRIAVLERRLPVVQHTDEY